MSFNVENSIGVFDIGLASAFGLLHLLLFWFYPKQRANLFYSLFAFGIALRVLATDTFDQSQLTAGANDFFNVASALGLAVAVFAFARFLYAAFEELTPIHFWIVAGAWLTASAVQILYAPAAKFQLSSLILIGFVVFESWRVLGRALLNKSKGSRIIGAGLFLLIIAPVNDLLRIMNVVNLNYFWNTVVNQISICGILAANSFYLARRFADTNLDLEAQLRQVKELSAREIEHERTAAELRLQNEQERAKRALVEQELDLAASIQQTLFPETLPNVEEYDIAAFNRPARVCGGDYYDVLKLEKDGIVSYLFCVADVAGKGLPAALLMSSMQANLRALAGYAASLAELATRIGELLFAASPSNKFITAILLEIEPQTGKARYVNAGHNECVLFKKNGDGELLKSTGLPLGMLGGMSYEEKTLKIEAGDVLVLYSDGVSEAQDKAEQEFGEERLNKCLKQTKDDSAQEIVSRIISEIDRFAADAPQHDDITLLVLRSFVE